MGSALPSGLVVGRLHPARPAPFPSPSSGSRAAGCSAPGPAPSPPPGPESARALTGAVAQPDRPQVKAEFVPAKYRTLMLNNHTHPLSGKDSAGGEGGVRSPGGTLKAAPKRAPKKAAKAPEAPAEVRFASVMDGHAPSAMATATRQAKAESLWAALSDIESEVFKQNEAQRTLKKKNSVQQQRSFLDAQVKEHAHARERAKKELEREARLIRQEVERYKNDELKVARQQQHYMARIKQEREDQVQQVQRQRRKERLIREREEDLELVEIQRQLEEEQKKKLDKLLKHKDEMVKVIEDNEARAVYKEKQLAKEKAEDERMRLQYTEMLAKQEAARNEALSAMYAKSQNRAAAAGAMAVKENKERAEKEMAMLEKLQLQRELDLQERERLDEKRRRMALAELSKVRGQQMAEKKAKQQREQQELEDYYEETRKKDELAKQKEEEKNARTMQENKQNQEDLRRQITETMQRRVMQDAIMTANEQKINHPVLASHGRQAAIGDETPNIPIAQTISF